MNHYCAFVPCSWSWHHSSCSRPDTRQLNLDLDAYCNIYCPFCRLYDFGRLCSSNRMRSFWLTSKWFRFGSLFYDADRINGKCNDNRIVLMAVCLLGSDFECEWNGPRNGWSTSRIMDAIAICRLYETKCITHAIWLEEVSLFLFVRCTRFVPTN